MEKRRFNLLKRVLLSSILPVVLLVISIQSLYAGRIAGSPFYYKTFSQQTALGCGARILSDAMISYSTIVPSVKIEAYMQPNPFENNGELVLLVPKNMQVTVVIYDVIGNEKAIIIQNQPLIAGEHTYSIPDNLSPGMYLVKIEGDQEVQTIRIIKSK